MPTDILSTLIRPNIPGFTVPAQIIPENRFAEQALARHKREGLNLAVRVRLVVMAVIGTFILFLTPWPGVLYYEVLIVLFVLIGLAQRHVATIGFNRWELLLLFCDLLLMMVICTVPNPFDDREFPLAFQYQFNTFIYFFTLLAGAALACSWRTLVSVGTWTAGLWALGALAIWALREDPTPWREATMALYPDETMAAFLDPSNIVPSRRIQEALVFLIVACMLAVLVRRFDRLLLEQAAVERERANLARYFSPNVVDQLSQNDDPLREVREQDVAVLFVDIVGFTTYAAERSPQDVIATLREFHALMEAEVFRHNGTLDKYLGDGLMATFGTPRAGARDAANAVDAALAMARQVEAWNTGRTDAIRASFGVHFGPVVVGDIGANRLEFAVIGSTVNLASRLEAMTRPLDRQIVISDVAMQTAQAQRGERLDRDWTQIDDQAIRGFEGKFRVWAWG